MALLRADIVDLMEFMVLGPLRVEDAGNLVPLGGPKQRTVLALLVASAGKVVSMDSLLIGAYGPEADPRARRSIQTWISGYRRHLDEAIVRRGDGYVLDVNPLSIDACRFEARVQKARGARQEDLAAELLREALALWRGRPYDDVEPALSLEAEARRLEALRADALDTRITLDFGAGRHRQLVAELETLVAERPHDESLRAHHIVALYRCGRQADALRAYRRTEEVLRDELGVDPSPELRSLEHRILTQDHSLDYRPRARTRPIPARFTSFVGRGYELGEVRDLVLGHRLVTITGPGGIGKSSLAIEASRSLIGEFATAFVPIEVNREADPWKVIAASVGLRGGDDADLPKLVSEAIGDSAMLMLLDGCEQVLDRLVTVAQHLLSSNPKLRILVTSREPIAMTGERVFRLGPLEQGEGSATNQLFLERAGLELGELDDEAVNQISTIGRRLSGLPLGIELAAAQMRTLPLNEVVARLDDQVTLLQTKRGAVPHQRSIVTALDWSYQLLDAVGRERFRRLGAFPTGRLPAPAVARVLDTEEPASALRALVDASLLSRPGPGDDGFSMLEPVRQYAAMRLEETGEAEAVRLRYAEWIVELCAASQVAALEGDMWAAIEMASSNVPSIAATATWAADHGFADIVNGIVAGVGRMWPRFADPSLLIEPGLRVIDQPATDELLRLCALAHLAFLHTPLRAAEAQVLLQRLEEEAVGELDFLTRHVVLSARVSVPYRIQRGMDAGQATLRRWLELEQEAAAALVAMGYPMEPMLYNRAIILTHAGNLDGERECLERLLAWAGEERPMWRGMALHALAKRQHLDGQAERGIASAREAARLLIEGGDLDFAAEAEYMLAGIYAAEEQFEEAAEALGRARDYHGQIGLPPPEEEEPGFVALVAAGMGEWDEFLIAARNFLQRVSSTEDESLREFLLRGEPGDTSKVARMIPAVARYLVAHDRPEDAARVLAAMDMAARQSTSPEVYETVGLLDRVRRQMEEIEADVATAAIPGSLEDLLSLMHSLVKGVRQLRDPS